MDHTEKYAWVAGQLPQPSYLTSLVTIQAGSQGGLYITTLQARHLQTPLARLDNFTLYVPRISLTPDPIVSPQILG